MRGTRVPRALVAVAALAVALAVTGVVASPAGAAKRDCAAVGDSITWGYGTSDPETRAYPTVAGVQGHGVNGSCLIEAHCPGVAILEWFETEVRAFEGRPGTVVALIGINDMVYSTNSDEEIIEGLQRLRRLARSMDVRLVHLGNAGERALARVLERWIEQDSEPE